ncbi:MAG: AAA family ATPase [Ktedonobacteraceae bacterium]
MSGMTPDLRARLEAFKAVRVKHPRLKEIDQAVTRAIYEHTSYSILTLYGPSGAGKSTITKRIAERCLEQEPNRAIVPVGFVEARPGDIGAYARLDYYRQVTTTLREHAAVKDRLMNLALAAKSNQKSKDPGEWLDMQEGVEYALERLQVRAVVIDEAQHLMRVEAPHKPVEQLDWLKSLMNRTNVLHILVGNYEMYDFCHLNGQAARRGRDLHFPRYHLDTKSECEEFVGALEYFLERVPLACDVAGLREHWRWFGEWSLGCIGILRDWVVETVAALCEEGSTTLTIEALKNHALQPDQRLRLEMEARAGEYKVEQEKARSKQQLEELLGTPMTEPQTLPANGTSTAHSLTQPPFSQATEPPKKTTWRRVGERAPQRDPIGEGPAEANTTKCSFSGPSHCSLAISRGP